MGGSALSASKPNTRLLEGQVIGGKYRVSHLLGEGGMASVWAGTNERTGKRVALKVIRSSFMATPDAEAFLHSEGLAASRVNHPNVVTVFDVIEHEGVACIVMELLDGLTLGTYISRNGQLSLRDAIGLLLPAMRGVAAAHAQGVIHRDLKPQNIFVCVGPDGRIVTTKVLDFGISIMMDWARGGSVTATPGLVGTPAYMSPEHIEGSAEIDERADVYGFGLLLYEALTARTPFPGEPGTELLRRVLTESPVPLRELRPDLPPSIVAIIETALAKAPNQRFASLNQMVSAIEDQIMPATPHPLTGTPVAGVPVASLSYTVSGPLALAVPAHIGKEPSGQYNETRIFGGLPARRESEQAAPNSEIVDEWSHKLAAVTTGTPVPASPALGTVGALPEARSMGDQSTEVHPLRAAVLRMLRDRRVLAGAGIVLVIAIGTWIAARSGGVAKKVAPMPAAQAPVHAISPSAPPPAQAVQPVVAVPTEPPTGQSPGLPIENPPAPPAASLGHDQADRALPRGSDLGERASAAETDAEVPSARRRPSTGKPVAAHPRKARRTTPRAGTLHVDDF